MPFFKCLFIHPDYRQWPFPLPGQAPPHGPLHDAPDFVPTQLQEAAGAQDRGALLEDVNNEAFHEDGKP
jgi:hypothetical protein